MGMVMNRHRKLRDLPDGDVVTKTLPGTDAEPDKVSSKGKRDKPTGENPTPKTETN